ncbi:MAG: EamA family transporter [Eubacteriales bacterium]|nr:EamA family transporter [Eubacteriales bacterium]
MVIAFLVTKVALTGLGPFTLSAVRILIAFAVLLPFALKRGFRLMDLLSKNAFLYGIFGYGGNLVLLSLGMVTCTANISAIIHGLFPVFMILFGYAMLSERITRNKILGIIFSVAGVIIASIGDLSLNSGTTLPGILLVSVSVIEQLITDFTMPGIEAVFSLFYLGIMSGALGILLWNFGLKKIDSAVAGIYFNLMPVIGLFFAVFAHEHIVFLQILGCVLILTGVFICSTPEAFHIAHRNRIN